MQRVGVDDLSVEMFKSPDHATHRALLRNHVMIIEGLNLSGVPVGDYKLIAFPLRFKGADGAPRTERLFTNDLSA